MSINTGLGPHWDQIVRRDLQPQPDSDSLYGFRQQILFTSLINPPSRPLYRGSFTSCSEISFALGSTQVLSLAFRNLESTRCLIRSLGGEPVVPTHSKVSTETGHFTAARPAFTLPSTRLRHRYRRLAGPRYPYANTPDGEPS